MGSKNNPGKFDCYAAAHPDEPMFTLLGRDPLAAGLVRIWAQLREGHGFAAIGTLIGLIQNEGFRYSIEPTRGDKIAEAVFCAAAMEAWDPNQTHLVLEAPAGFLCGQDGRTWRCGEPGGICLCGLKEPEERANCAHWTAA